MVAISFRNSGFPQARALLSGVIAGAKAAVSKPLISLTNKEPYAGAINRGTFVTGPRAGQSSRKAGPARMYEQGIDDVRPQIGPTMAKAIPGGAAAVEKARIDLNKKAVEAVRPHTPVRSGDLRAGVEPTRGTI